MLAGLLNAWLKRFPVLAGQHGIGLGGASNSRGSAPSLNHTCREICVISLATFTILVCRWIASETYLADEPPRSKRFRPRKHSDVDQCETSTTGLTTGSELFTVLPAEAARVAGEEVQPRKLSRVRCCTDAADTSQGRTNTHLKTTRRRRTCAAPPPRRVVFP